MKKEIAILNKNCTKYNLIRSADKLSAKTKTQNLPKTIYILKYWKQAWKIKNQDECKGRLIFIGDIPHIWRFENKQKIF